MDQQEVTMSTTTTTGQDLSKQNMSGSMFRTAFPPAGRGSPGPTLPGTGDMLFGNRVSADQVRTYFRDNATPGERIKSFVKFYKSFFVFESLTDPYVVFCFLIGGGNFQLQDMIIMMGMVMVFGRSLSNLKKQAEKGTDIGKKFLEICTRYRIWPTYRKPELRGEQVTWTTKVEHCFGAFPLVAQEVMLQLVSDGYINIKTCFTTAGLDFQSSTALALWKDIDSAFEKVFVHEIKNQLYIAARTFGQDMRDLQATMVFKGKTVTIQEGRRLNALQTRGYILIGILSPDILVKMLWFANINCPPFKAYPAPYMFAERIQSMMNTAAPDPIVVNTSWDMNKVTGLAKEIVSRFSLKGAWMKDVAKRGYHELGYTYEVLSEKLSLFEFVCRCCGKNDMIEKTYTKFGLNRAAFTIFDSGDTNLTTDNAFEALRTHYTPKQVKQ